MNSKGLADHSASTHGGDPCVEDLRAETRIPFNRPFIAGNELRYVAEAVRAGHASGNGQFTKRCQAWLERTIGVPKVLLTTSCTHALEMAALLLEVGPGDEVIVPSFTFVSTVNAFALRGARPVFADIRPDTMNIDESTIGSLITQNTKAIVPVHYAGVGCQMDAILEVAGTHEVSVIEDNAHGLLGSFQGRQLGTFGRLATQSFHDTKNLSCGEGGALLINDTSLVERAEILRDKGTDRGRFFRGQVDKYTWVDVGSSYVPSDLLAAFLYGQLEAAHRIQNKRERIWNHYYRSLGDWAGARGIGLPTIPPDREQSYHMFYLVMPTLDDRQHLIEHLKRRGILSVFHYQPLHTSTMGRQWGYASGDLPVTEDVSDRLLRLPFFNDLTEAELSRVVQALHDW